MTPPQPCTPRMVNQAMGKATRPRRRPVNSGPGLWVCLAALVVLAGLGPTTALGAVGRLHSIVGSTVSFSSDGSRYAAWQTASHGPIVAFDTQTGRRWTAQAGGCALDDAAASGDGLPAGDGRFLALCGSATQLLDVKTGTMTPLPSAAEDPSWVAVGSRYVEGRATKDKCRQNRVEVREQQPCVALYEIATGAVSYRPQSEAADLDRPGAPLICKVIRSRFDEDRVLYSDGVLALPGQTTVRIYRCHGRPKTLKAPRNAVDVQLSGGAISWDTGVHAEELPDPSEGLHGALTAYSLRSGRRREFSLPRIRVAGIPEHPGPGVFGYSTHTAGTVFWVAARTVIPGREGVTNGTSEVYAARL
jgi:hypothetical protein